MSKAVKNYRVIEPECCVTCKHFYRTHGPTQCNQPGGPQWAWDAGDEPFYRVCDRFKHGYKKEKGQ